MVAVLLPPARIDPRRLNVSVGRGTDPDELVGRWDADRLDAPYDQLVRDALAVLVVVGERSARPLSAIARRRIDHVAQTLLGDRRGDFRDVVRDLFGSAFAQHLLGSLGKALTKQRLSLKGLRCERVDSFLAAAGSGDGLLPRPCAFAQDVLRPLVSSKAA